MTSSHIGFIWAIYTDLYWAYTKPLPKKNTNTRPAMAGLHTSCFSTWRYLTASQIWWKSLEAWHAVYHSNANGPVGLRCFWSPKHAWIMLDQVGFTNTIHNFRQLWWDVTCLSWCRLLYIHHHSPYFKPGSWPTSVINRLCFSPRTQRGFAPSAPAWCSGNAPPSNKQCNRSPPAAQAAVEGRWMAGRWFSKNLPCLCFHVWHCLYGKDNLDWFEIVWACLMFWTTLLGTTFDVSFILGFIHRELVIGGDFTCHLLAAWTLKSPPKADNFFGIETLKIHPFDFNLWFHLLPPLRWNQPCTSSNARYMLAWQEFSFCDPKR